MTAADTRRLSRTALASCVLVGAVLFLGLVALGVWQVERRAWKLDLIAQVDARVRQPAVEAPGPAAWAALTPARDAYRHVRLAGTFQHDREALVQAVTVLGPGHWVMTPLRLADGSTVLVNRGFVPTDRGDPASRADTRVDGQVAVEGLLRFSEPGGGFLRKNDAAADRWYSRDVAAIAAARGVGPVAPYFVDADAAPGERPGTRWPAGGLTVVSFPNSHLVYALTWFGLAAMVGAGTGYLVWTERRRTMAA